VADDLVDEFDRGIERARVARVLNTQRLGIDHSLIKVKYTLILNALLCLVF